MAAPFRPRASSAPWPHGVMFHHFHGGGHPKVQGSISASDLGRLIEHLGPDRFLPARRWYQAALAGTLRRRDLCLTFDDNLRCQYEVAYPVLRSYGMTAFWFVYTSVLDGGIELLEVYRRYRNLAFPSLKTFYAAFDLALAASPFGQMAEDALKRFVPEEYLKDYAFYTPSDRRFYFLRDEVLGPVRYSELMSEMMRGSKFNVAAAARDLWLDAPAIRRLHDDGNIIGLHSHSHPVRLSDFPLKAQKGEYLKNSECLKRITGEAPSTVSHPCNSYGTKTLPLLRSLGVRLGFRADMAGPARSDLEYPRIDHADIMAVMARKA